MGIESVQAPKTPFNALIAAGPGGDVDHADRAGDPRVALGRHGAGLFVVVTDIL